MKTTDFIFRDIKGAIASYKTNLSAAKTNYESETNLSPEDYTPSYIDSKKLAAKQKATIQIDKAMKAFSTTMESKTDLLAKILTEHFTEQPSGKLLASLAVYRDFGICPGRIEIDNLLNLSEGKSLAVRAINAVLERTYSPYRITTHDDELESDLRLLQKMGTDAIPSLDLVSFVANATGKDFNACLIAASEFSSNVAKLDSIAARWDNRIPPTVTAKKDYHDLTDSNTGERITAEQQIELDRQKAIESAEVEAETDAVAYASRLARQEREEAERAKAALEKYT